MITIQELLFNRGLDVESKVKLVSHKDGRLDLYNLYRSNKKAFLDYQNHQSQDVFKDVNYIISFIGEDGVRSRLIGIFKVLSSVIGNDNHFQYKMEEVPGFDDLKERVIINWTNPRRWDQWIKNEMEVVQIHPGLHYKQFTDYSDFILDFEELKEIVEKQYADWKKMLSATKGIYLINDTQSGKLYVGSAYGEEGIWGRWKEYVRSNGHGGNKLLKKLILNDKNYSLNFQFSILMLLPRTITPDQAIKKEKLFKHKLGTNSFGLNDN